MQPKPKIHPIKQTACQLFFSCFLTFFSHPGQKTCFFDKPLPDAGLWAAKHCRKFWDWGAVTLPPHQVKDGWGQPNC
jgi:hypothetical protein